MRADLALPQPLPVPLPVLLHLTLSLPLVAPLLDPLACPLPLPFPPRLSRMSGVLHVIEVLLCAHVFRAVLTDFCMFGNGLQLDLMAAWAQELAGLQVDVLEPPKA